MTRLRLTFFALLIATATATPAAAQSWLAAVRERMLGQQPSPVVTLDQVAAHIRTLPADDTLVLAGEAGADGHWRLVNRAGETFSAATPDELTRAFANLLPVVVKPPDTRPRTKEPSGPGRPAIYVTDESIFRHAEALNALPPGVWTYMRTADGDVRIIRNAHGPARWMVAVLRETPDAGRHLKAQEKSSSGTPPGRGLFLEVSDRASFDEARRLLARPLAGGPVHVIALEPGAKPAVRDRPKPATGKPVPPAEALPIERVDPDHLRNAFGVLRGATVLMVGRIEGERLVYQPSSGPERSALLADYTRAAADYDVDLLIIHSGTARQPGTRNWLWLKADVQGLEQSLRAPTLADALVGLIGDSAGVQLALKRHDGGRTHLVGVAAYAVRGRPSTSVFGTVGEVVNDLVAGVTGTATASRLEAQLVGEARRTELRARVVPRIPALPQLAFLMLLVVALPGLAVARRWWARLWPAEVRSEYGSSFGWAAARVVRGLAFTLLFLPLAGWAATIAQASRLMLGAGKATTAPHPLAPEARNAAP